MNAVLLERRGTIKIHENRLGGKRNLKTYKHITIERVRVTCPEQIIGKLSDSSLELLKIENYEKQF